jgi:hypothetical protein
MYVFAKKFDFFGFILGQGYKVPTSRVTLPKPTLARESEIQF